jgi:hypothetical protein
MVQGQFSELITAAVALRFCHERGGNALVAGR